jgi:hypothetical protein
MPETEGLQRVKLGHFRDNGLMSGLLESGLGGAIHESTP